MDPSRSPGRRVACWSSRRKNDVHRCQTSCCGLHLDRGRSRHARLDDQGMAASTAGATQLTADIDGEAAKWNVLIAKKTITTN